LNRFFHLPLLRSRGRFSSRGGGEIILAWRHAIKTLLVAARFMGYLKGKSSLMIFDRHANLKYKYGSRNFLCRGYYVDTVGKNKKMIAEYIKNQFEEDYARDQISIKEYTDPFTGSKNK